MRARASARARQWRESSAVTARHCRLPTRQNDVARLERQELAAAQSDLAAEQHDEKRNPGQVCFPPAPAPANPGDPMLKRSALCFAVMALVVSVPVASAAILQIDSSGN